MLSNPASKYRSFPPVALADRQWPNVTISKPPIWMSTDLRDGNQSLFEPMNAERKTRMFEMLCARSVSRRSRSLSRRRRRPTSTSCAASLMAVTFPTT
jgi:hypothetical protein